MNKNSNGICSSPWADFRILCRYYADCVTAAEKPKESVCIKNEHRNFLIVNPTTGWLNGVEEFTVNYDAVRDRYFCNTLETVKEYDETIYVGYPCEVYSTGNENRAAPIFLIPVTVEQGDGCTLRLTPDFSSVKLNHQWVNFNVSKQERTTFFNAIYNTDGIVDFAAARAYFESNMPDVADAYNPNICNVSFDLSRDRMKLQNVAILSKGLTLVYSKNLRRELYQIANESDEILDKTALAYVFRNPKLPNVNPDSEPFRFPLNFLQSNREQQRALIEALNCPCSKIQGPPGTGKSQAAVNILMNLAYHGKSALFTSKNHRAIHAIDEKVTRVFANHDEAVRTGFSLVQSCSNVDGSVNMSWVRSNLEAMQAAVEIITGSELSLLSIADDVRQGLEDWADAWRYLEDYQKTRRAVEQAVNDVEIRRAAIKIPLDVNVKELKKDATLLKRKRGDNFLARIVWRWRKMDEKLNFLECEMRKSYPRIIAPNRFLFGARLLEQIPRLQEFKKAEKTVKPKYEEIKNLPRYEDVLRQAFDAHSRVESLQLRGLFSQLRERTKDIPDNLIARLRTIARKLQTTSSVPWLSKIAGEDIHKEVEDVFRELTMFYPVWVCTLLSLSKASPCCAGVFDRVVVDEAAQCELPPLIPALFRAKGVTVIGDPMQFPPVIDLPDVVHEHILYKHGLDDRRLAQFEYRTENVYNAIPCKVILLCEHFRCAPGIIQFCSENYYHGKLIVRTSENREIPSLLGYTSSFTWEEVSNSASGEVERLKERLDGLAKIKDSLPEDFSIGVITPFRDSVNDLQAALRHQIQALGNHLTSEHINTVNSFQGGECDVIFLLLQLTAETSRGQEWYATESNHAYIYNVAVSRAKHCCVIIGDRKKAAELNSSSLRKLAQPPRVRKPDGCKIGPGEKVLKDALEKVGIKTESQYRLLNRWLDLAIVDAKIDIEIDGISFHVNEQGNRKQDDYYRDREVFSQGWEVKRYWHHDIMNPKKLPEIVNEILAESMRITNRQESQR